MIRLAKETDAAALLAIYAQYIETGITFETELPSVAEFADRIRRFSEVYPYLLWEEDGCVLGYAYAHRAMERAAYGWNCELSVYVDKDAAGRGIGTKLYERLLAILKEMNVKNVYALVTSPNEPSTRLHERMGFAKAGVLHNTGYKAGMWRDVTYYEMQITPYDDPPAPIRSVWTLDLAEFGLQEANMDRTIPFFNAIFRCDRYETTVPRLPDGYALAEYRPGMEDAWARLEHDIGDFDTEREAKEYFLGRYAAGDARDILFAVSPAGEIAGACIAWRDERNGEYVPSLHWLVVDEKHRRKGLGRALCAAGMNRFFETGGAPVYIHTQPWSWEAMLLYRSLGFRLQRTDTFGGYVNQYEDVAHTLFAVLPEETARRITE